MNTEQEILENRESWQKIVRKESLEAIYMTEGLWIAGQLIHSKFRYPFHYENHWSSVAACTTEQMDRWLVNGDNLYEVEDLLDVSLVGGTNREDFLKIVNYLAYMHDVGNFFEVQHDGTYKVIEQGAELNRAGHEQRSLDLILKMQNEGNLPESVKEAIERIGLKSKKFGLLAHNIIMSTEVDFGDTFLQAGLKEDSMIHQVLAMPMMLADIRFHSASVCKAMEVGKLNEKYENYDDKQGFIDSLVGFTLLGHFAFIQENKGGMGKATIQDFLNIGGIRKLVLENIKSINKVLPCMSFDALHRTFERVLKNHDESKRSDDFEELKRIMFRLASIVEDIDIDKVQKANLKFIIEGLSELDSAR